MASANPNPLQLRHRTGKILGIADNLTRMQRLFCEFFVANGGKASDAYREAGYAPKNADVNSNKLLSNPSIQPYLKYLLERQFKIDAAFAGKQLRNLAENGQLSDAVKLKATSAILNFAGMQPATKSESVVEHRHMLMSPEEKQARFKDFHKALGYDHPVIDITPNEYPP